MKRWNAFVVVVMSTLGIIFPLCGMENEQPKQVAPYSNVSRVNGGKNDYSHVSNENIQKAYASMAARLDDFWLDGDLTQECKNRVFTTMVNHLEKTNKDS